MKHLFPAPLILILAGCAFLNPKAAQEDKLAAVEKTFNSTVATLTQLRADGKLSDANWREARELAEGIDASIESLHDKLDAGQKIDVNAALDSIRAALDRLNTYKSETTNGPGDASDPLAPVGPGRDAREGRVHARAA